MALRRRIIEIAYELKDRFTRGVARIAGGIRTIETEAERSAGRVERANRRIQASYTSLGGIISRFRGLILGAFTGATAKGILDVNIQFERLLASLETVTGSRAGAEAAFAEIERFAETTPFQVEEVAQAFIRLKALGLDPSQEALRSYGNTAAAFGTSLSQFIEAVADATTGEFERLKEFGIKAKTEGENVKFTFQGVTTTVRKNAAEINEYLLNIGKVQFAGATERQVNTLGGAISNLKDAFSTAAREIGQSGLNRTIRDLLKRTADGIKEQRENLKILLSGLARGFVVTASTIRIAWNTVTAAVAAAITVITTAIAQILKALSAITFGDLSKQYASLAEGMSDITQSIKDGVITDLGDIKSAVSDIGTAFEDADVAPGFVTGGGFGDELEAQVATQESAAQRTVEIQKQQIADQQINHNIAQQAEQARTERLKEQLKEREDVLKQHTDRVRTLREAEKKVAEEFAGIVEEIRSEPEAEEPVELFDIAAQRTEARKAIAEGDFTAAIAAAREGAELIRQMKEEGGEANIVLTGMALSLQQVANEAARARTEQGVGLAEGAQEQVDQVTRELVEGPVPPTPVKVPIEFDFATARQNLTDSIAATQQAVAQTPIRISVDVQGNPIFSDGTFSPSPENEVLTESNKRGFRP